MFRKIAFAGCAVALLIGALPAHASLSTNGRSWQGVELNGRSIQGVQINGRSIQGVEINGRSIQGVEINGHGVQGVSLPGTDFDAASALAVVGVELPTPSR